MNPIWQFFKYLYLSLKVMLIVARGAMEVPAPRLIKNIMETEGRDNTISQDGRNSTFYDRTNNHPFRLAPSQLFQNAFFDQNLLVLPILPSFQNNRKSAYKSPLKPVNTMALAIL